MSDPRHVRSRGLAALLTIALAAGAWTTPTAHAWAPLGEYERHIAEADAHTSGNRHAKALASYGKALASMPADEKAGPVAEYVATAAARAAVEDFETHQDPASLHRGIEILDAFIEATANAKSGQDVVSPDSAKVKRAELEALLPEVPVAPPEPEPVETEEPIDEPRDADPPIVDKDPRGPSKAVGITLLAAGGVSLLGGAALIVAGVRQVPWYEEQLLDAGWQTTDPTYDDQVADAERIRTIDVAIGAGLGAVGVALGITGAVLLARANKARRDVAWGVDLRRDRAMIGLRARF